MDPKLFDKRQRDEQQASDSQDQYTAQLESRLKEVHTCIPGIIKKFDEGIQWAEVQPTIRRIFTTNGPVDLPLCVDVPVMFPSGSRFFITWPVFPGDECLLFFSERCIDRWALEGDIQEPDDYRMHDLSDGFAFVGVNSLPLVIEDFQMDGIDIRSPLRESYVKVKKDTIEVHASVLVDVKAPTIRATATELVEALAPTITAKADTVLNGEAPTVNLKGTTLNAEFTTMNLKGDIVHTNGNFSQTGGTITHDSKNIGKDHKHSGVATGVANTGNPI